jgi:hypothetical protein
MYSGGHPTPPDPGLQGVIEAWDRLPQPIKAAILALVRTATVDEPATP